MQCRSEKESGREEANETSEQTTWVLLSKGRDSVEGGNIAGDLNCEAERGKCFDLGKRSYGKEGIREGFLQLDLEG